MGNVSRPKGDAGGLNLREKISWFEYFSYGIGDLGCAMVWMLSAGMVTFFYTDYVGVSAATVGTILLVSRVFDGVTDVLVGGLVDKTKSRHGKCRAWILWSIIPFGLSLVLMYTVPQGSDMLKAIYVFLTYNLAATVVYTAINLPYGALPSTMTRDKKQREWLVLVRKSLSPFGLTIASSLSLPMVKYFGDDQRAWIITMTILAFLGMGVVLMTFLFTKERVVIEPAPEQETVPFKVALKAMVSNKYWWMIFIMCIGFCLYQQLNSQVVTYYAKYILGDDLLTSGLSAAHNLMNIVAAISCFLLLRWISKSKLVILGSALIIVACVVMIMNPTNVGLLTVVMGIRGFGIGMFSSLMFAMVVDTVEYGHWKTGIRSEGLLYSANTVGQKVGTGVGAAAIGWILEAAEYDGTLDVQTEAANDAIMMLMNVGPIVAAVLILVLCLFYKLDKEYDGIMEDLLNGRYSPTLDIEKVKKATAKK